MKIELWNNYDGAMCAGRPIVIPFGRWPWSETVDQTFAAEEAKAIAADLEKKIAGGEPGIPVYQGHPDVPVLAAKYPDKAALGWVKKIEVGETECRLYVEWERFPGKGFGWFSPYWFGVGSQEGSKTVVKIDEIRSIGLVNRPNIKEFRLPNEEVADYEREKHMKEILTALGLPETATTEEAVAKVGELKANAEKEAADKAKAEADKVALDDECKKQKCANEELQKQLDEAKVGLENSKKELEETKTALANERAELEKVKNLKTVSTTAGLPNEGHDTDTRLGLVNEIMHKEKCDFDHAWAAAKNQKPELFK